MRPLISTLLIPTVIAVLALVVVQPGGAVGPSLWTVDGGAGITNARSDVRYVTHAAGGTTVVRAIRKSDGSVARSVSLPGRWGIQAVTLGGAVGGLSPNGRLLYLIQHLEGRDSTSYRVRAFDLTTRRLLPGVVADKRQAGWTMRGFPIARAAKRDGSSVYTLYQPGANYPFVHALDTRALRITS